MITTRPRVRHIVATLCALAIAVGPWTTCGGWEPTPEQRMACCLDDGCPMHQSERQSEHAGHAAQSGASNGHSHAAPVTQADADQCCLASEADNAPRPADARVAAMTIDVISGPVHFFQPPPLAQHRLRPPLIDDPVAPVPRHLLLSVLLI